MTTITHPVELPSIQYMTALEVSLNIAVEATKFDPRIACMTTAKNICLELLQKIEVLYDNELIYGDLYEAEKIFQVHQSSQNLITTFLG